MEDSQLIDETIVRPEVKIPDHTKNYIKYLSECSLSELESELGKVTCWNSSKTDLYYWVPLLNRMDSILKEKVTKYNLEEEFAKPVEIQPADESLLAAILTFSSLLFANCYNNSIYASTKHVYNLINCCSVPVLLAALRLCVALGDATIQTGTMKYKESKVIDKFVNMSIGFLPPTPPVLSNKPVSLNAGSPTDPGSEGQFNLADCCKLTSRKVPTKWKMLDFEYYNSDEKRTNEIGPKRKKSKLTPTNTQSSSGNDASSSKQKSVNFSREGVQHLIISEENMRKFSLQQIFDKFYDKLPKECFFDFALAVQIAKAFNTDTFESLKLRQQLVSIKCMAISYLSCMQSATDFLDSVLSSDSTLINDLCELIDPSLETPDIIYESAGKALECISYRKVFSLEILKALNGHVSYGSLFRYIKQYIKMMKDDSVVIPENRILLFNLLRNLLATKHVAQSLSNTDILTLLIDLLSIRSSHRFHLSAGITVLCQYIEVIPRSLDKFILNNGFQLLLKAIDDEIHYSLQNPGIPPADIIVSYNISFHQMLYLRELMIFVLSLIQTDSGDRMRNLFDSILLEHFNLVLDNPKTFGSPIVICVVSSVSAILHTEPTAFSILNESGTIDRLLKSYPQLFDSSNDLIQSLFDVFGALSLNKDGLNKVVESKSIDIFFEIFRNDNYSYELVEAAPQLANSLDQLTRHFPELKPIVMDNIIRLIEDIPNIVSKTFPPTEFFQHPNGSFYKSKDDVVVEKEEGVEKLKPLEATRGGLMYENVTYLITVLLEHNSRWKDITKKITFQKLLKFIIIDNAPYDFIVSDSLYSFMGVLKYYDDEDRNYGFVPLLDCIDEYTWKLHEFTHYEKDDVSFFSQYEKMENGNIIGGKVIDNMKTLNALFFLLTDSYFSPGSLFSERMGQASSYFTSQKGAKLLKELVLYFRRLILEEVIIQRFTPDSVCEDTTFFAKVDFAPVQMTLGKQSDVKKKIDSAPNTKSKNIAQLRLQINRAHTWLGFTFGSICRITMHKTQDRPASLGFKNAVHILSDFTIYITELYGNISTQDILIERAYHGIVTSLLYRLLVTRSRTLDLAIFAFAIVLLQSDTFQILKKLLISCSTQLTTFDPEKLKEESKNFKTVSMNIESLTLHTIRYILSIFAIVGNKSNLTLIPAARVYYEGDISGFGTLHNELVPSFLTQFRLFSLGMLLEVLSPLDDGIDLLSFDKVVRSFPPVIVELFITISKNAYSHLGENSSTVPNGLLYPLVWQNVHPTNSRVDYLVSLGLDRSDALEFLKSTGNSLAPILKDEVPFYQGDLSQDRIEELAAEAKNRPYIVPKLEPLKPQYSNFSTHDELVFLRKANESAFVERWFIFAELFPDCVEKLSDLLIHVFLKNPGTTSNFERTILSTLLAIILSLDTSSSEDEDKLAGTIGLFANLIKDSEVYDLGTESLEGFLSFCADSISAEFVNCSWFPKLLFAFEHILVFTSFPEPEKLEVGIADIVEAQIPKFADSYRAPSAPLDEIFDTIIHCKNLKTMEVTIALSRVLSIFAKDDLKARKIFDSGILNELIRASSLFTDDSNFPKLQNYLLLLMRTCMETGPILETLMDHYLQKKLSDSRTLSTLLKANGVLAARNPQILAECIGSSVRLSKCVDPLESLSIVPLKKGNEIEDSIMTDATTGKSTDELSEEPDYRQNTGLVHTLILELMSVCKNDIFSSPESSEPISPDNIRKSKQKLLKLFENKHFGYAVFLLHATAELVSSYKQSKLEFLTFSRKKTIQSCQRPRPTALNFILHTLLGTENSGDFDESETQRRVIVSNLIKMIVFGFVSTPISKFDPNLPTKVDPDMTYVRQFTTDVLSKVLTDTHSSVESPSTRYRKLSVFTELLQKLISEKRDLCGHGLDILFTKYDAYQMTKVLVEKNFASLLTSLVSSFDLNFPNANGVMKPLLGCISSLGRIKHTYSDLLKDGQDGEDTHSTDSEEEEDNDEDMDNRDDTPNLLRNSTLGMYDVADVDNEDYSSEGGYEGGYEDLSEDNEHGPIEIIFSDDEDDDIEDDENDTYQGSSDMVIEDLDSAEIIEDDSNSEGPTDEEYEIVNNGNFLINGREYENVEYDESDAQNDASFDEEVPFDSENPSFDDDAGDDTDYDGWLNILGAEDGDEDEEDEDEDNEHEELNRHHIGSRRGRQIVEIDRLGEEDPDLFASGNMESSRLRSMIEHLFEADDQIAGAFERDGVRVSVVDNNGLIGLVDRPSKFMKPPSLEMKSSYERWSVANDIYGKVEYDALRLLPGLINMLFPPSYEIYKEKKEREEQKRLEREREIKRQQEEREKELLERERSRQLETEQQQSQVDTADAESDEEDSEPIIINIGGEDVDIRGTGIDPSFLLALPDDMREEVFTQHIRERRAQSSGDNASMDDIPSEFLEALPDSIRREVQTEESNFRNFLLRGNDEDDSDQFDLSEETDSASQSTKKKFVLKKHKYYRTPLVDKFGICALIRFLFLPQNKYDIDSLKQAFLQLSHNKQTRSEIMQMLLLVLHEATQDQKAIERIFYQLTSRSNSAAQKILLKEEPISDGGIDSKELALQQFPISCTPLILSTQALEIINYLLNADVEFRYYFLTLHDHQQLLKKFNKKQKLKEKDSYQKGPNYPINSLLSLLDRNIFLGDSFVLKQLCYAVHIATKPLGKFKKLQEKKLKDGETVKPDVQFPFVSDENLKKLVSILVTDDCTSSVFRKVVGGLQNLSILEEKRSILAQEISENATNLGKQLVVDLEQLSSRIKNADENVDELSSETLEKFTTASSKQAKLLRVLTALDYLFYTKKSADASESEIEALTNLYKSLALGPLWGGLSECLVTLRDKKTLQYIATILSPLIESLMVVCKHSKVKELPIREVLKYEQKKNDFVNEPIESLFFTFTDEHKKILNQMVRVNPKLMSGPFSMLVRNPRVLEFDCKKNYFDQRLHEGNEKRPKLSISVSREQVFLDSYRALFFKKVDEIKNSKLEISFKGEAGVDAGGVTREWYQVLSRQMFNPDYALFIPVASDKTTFHPNRTSYINPEHLSFFKFIGRIIGKAVYDNCFLDCHFSRAVYKRILGRQVTLKDMETLDLDYYKSLVWILENDITDIIDETFSVESDDYGVHTIVDLKPNGRNILVTEENKQEYVRLITEYRLQTSVKEQMNNFLIGFHEIIPKDLVAIFGDQELELLISGLPDIDVDDWKANAVYENYSPSSIQIQWFWRAVRSFDVEERAKLLQFATGTSKVPLGGFKELTGVDGVSKFSIHRDYGSTDRLPSSHTCFNQIDLPEYESYETLRGSLLLAVTEGHEGFGLV
ncbi:E3 ubiquitin-protein ligase [Komagataella phaffii]|uniref:HECT-type E3 ubiquitin transferase n=1 Tax=Komagataella phaffii (strain GS115 / ATCC 20864) TaxID=644223 RepID=C4R3D7_KOMPG|nr:E3 ubiquitin ligase of the hect-domain class [Komagataella phaffii GS115]AOA69338.1 GQ68_03041T0 [Komagataella phaffii GS115]CAY69972.1 E3 ubiquitin ligase of the hect-domain class [Komagataella phaffii GS115]